MFAVLWAATVLGNVGSFMRDVASSWMVTDLSASPTAVALIQTAATLPIFLLAIPAGVLSDILDRRRFLIFVQLLLASVSGTLLLLSHTGALTVDYLIALTFVGGIGAALMGPTWQSIVPELVPRADLKGAVALNSLGINIARAIGPAAGGLILASFGAAVTYGMDVLSYVFVIAALLWWKRPAAADSALSENFLGAFRAGLRYTRASRSCTACCCAPPCSSCSPARCGPCCRWWRARCWADPRASTACCWARWARGDPGRAAAAAPGQAGRGRPGAAGVRGQRGRDGGAGVRAAQVAGRAAAGRAGHGLDHGAHHLQQRGPGHPAQLRAAVAWRCT